MKNVFVDGYNVINSWPGLRDIIEYNLEAARQKLIDILQNYAVYKGYKVFIVFDAHMKKGSLGNKEFFSGVVVIYTKEGETADSYIEKAVNDIGRTTEVCVVTSDSLEQQLIFQRGAIRSSSTEFYFEVKEVEGIIKTETERSKAQKKYLLEDRMKKEVWEKLEKIRRNR
ncbi:MAG: NYN domain-containing protein [Clostridiaceae bacterium]|nr:NYN domain-containing protein [Clostridiaceae bacterium]